MLFATNTPDSPKLSSKEQRRLQSIIGAFLYYGQAIDPTILLASNDLSTYQADPTMEPLEQTKMLMDYLSTFPTAKLCYYAGDMQLHVESDATYLVLPGARSRVTGYFYLSAGASPTKVYKNFLTH